MKRLYDVLKDCKKEEEVKSEFCKFFKMKINALKTIDHYTETISLWVVVLVLVAGCESAHVGMGIPVPGPVKPSVGVTVNKSGVKGHGGISAKAGPVPISIGGTTKPVKLMETSEPAKATKKSK